jgi:hypothetical protein
MARMKVLWPRSLLVMLWFCDSYIFACRAQEPRLCLQVIHHSTTHRDCPTGESEFWCPVRRLVL